MRLNLSPRTWSDLSGHKIERNYPGNQQGHYAASIKLDFLVRQLALSLNKLQGGAALNMRLHLRWVHLAVALSVLFLGLCSIWLSRPLWLTWMHSEEMRQAVQRYLDVTTTIEGNRDPDVIAQVATGNHLKDLIRYRCVKCPRIQVATLIHIPILEVWEYSATTSRVRARVEWGWHWVDSSTRIVISECHAQAYTIILILSRENGVWKISEIGEIGRDERNPIDDTPELRAKYCPTD